jgi:hypothetical protein
MFADAETHVPFRAPGCGSIQFVSQKNENTVVVDLARLIYSLITNQICDNAQSHKYLVV